MIRIRKWLKFLISTPYRNLFIFITMLFHLFVEIIGDIEFTAYGIHGLFGRFVRKISRAQRS